MALSRIDYSMNELDNRNGNILIMYNLRMVKSELWGSRSARAWRRKSRELRNQC